MFTKTISTPCTSVSIADIRLNAYPDKVFKGRIDNILPILDPSIRTAKVRLEVANPGRDARGHVRYRDVLWQAAGNARRPFRQPRFCTCMIASGFTRRSAPGHFKRLEVVTGGMLARQPAGIVSGIKPGDQVVSNALALQNTVEQVTMIRRVVDFALNNRLLVLALALSALRRGHRLVSSACPLRPIPMSPTTTSRSLPNGREFRPSKSNSRLRFRSKSP